MTYATGAWGPEAQERSKGRKEYFSRQVVKNGSAKRNRKYGIKLREKAVVKLGGKCVDCGFNDQRALQIDHVNNDGYTERKLIQTRATYLNKVINDKTGKYQLLCANCNWIKKYNNNEVRSYEKQKGGED